MIYFSKETIDNLFMPEEEMNKITQYENLKTWQSPECAIVYRVKNGNIYIYDLYFIEDKDFKND